MKILLSIVSEVLVCIQISIQAGFHSKNKRSSDDLLSLGSSSTVFICGDAISTVLIPEFGAGLRVYFIEKFDLSYLILQVAAITEAI
jgi:hypothetical protein